MSLTSALHTAKRSLSNTAIQTSAVSRNVANAENPNYARRVAVLETDADGGAQYATTVRKHDSILYAQNLVSGASESGQKAVLEGLQQLRNIFGTNDYELSPAVIAGKLQNSLSAYSIKPSDGSLAQTAISDAIDLANSLQTATSTVQNIRTSVDNEIGRSVTSLNEMLERYEVVNTEIERSTVADRDISSYLDERESLTKQISAIIEVQVVHRENNDIALYTADGTTLFETKARSVEFEETVAFGPLTAGKSIYIDGVPISAGTGANSTSNGSLQGLLQIRDDLAPKMQTQLDEISRGLITTFKEVDKVSTGPDLPGLFTWAGGTIPTAGTIEHGIAATIEVNPAVLTSASGDPTKLRDGGINGTNYSDNPSGAASFSTRLDELVTGMRTPITFDSIADIGANKSVIDFATDSLGWLELNRSNASAALESKAAYHYQLSETLSNNTGVNIDDELALLLTLEQSYKAASRILGVLDELLQTLIGIGR